MRSPRERTSRESSRQGGSAKGQQSDTKRPGEILVTHRPFLGAKSPLTAPVPALDAPKSLPAFLPHSWRVPFCLISSYKIESRGFEKPGQGPTISYPDSLEAGSGPRPVGPSGDTRLSRTTLICCQEKKIRNPSTSRPPGTPQLVVFLEKEMWKVVRFPHSTPYALPCTWAQSSYSRSGPPQPLASAATLSPLWAFWVSSASRSLLSGGCSSGGHGHGLLWSAAPQGFIHLLFM